MRCIAEIPRQGRFHSLSLFVKYGLEVCVEKPAIGIGQVHYMGEEVFRLHSDQSELYIAAHKQDSRTFSSLFVGLSPLKWYLNLSSNGCTITSSGNKMEGSTPD